LADLECLGDKCHGFGAMAFIEARHTAASTLRFLPYPWFHARPHERDRCEECDHAEIRLILDVKQRMGIRERLARRVLDFRRAALEDPRKRVSPPVATRHDRGKLGIEVERGVELQVRNLMGQRASVSARGAIEYILADPKDRSAGIAQVGGAKGSGGEAVGGLGFDFVSSGEVSLQIDGGGGLGQALDLPQLVPGNFFDVLPRKMISLR